MKKSCWCITCANIWEAPAHLGWRMWYLMVEKNVLLSCCWKRHHIFFLLVRLISTVVGQFVIGGVFLFFIFSLFSLKSYRLIIFVVNISTFFIILLIFNFVLGPFVKQYLFLISLLNSNLSYVIFSNLILTILISSFFPWSIS
jgi:hypothetical protein